MEYTLLLLIVLWLQDKSNLYMLLNLQSKNKNFASAFVFNIPMLWIVKYEKSENIFISSLNGIAECVKDSYKGNVVELGGSKYGEAVAPTCGWKSFLHKYFKKCTQ